MATLVVAALSAAGTFGTAGAVSTAVYTAAAYAAAAYVDSLWISRISQPDPIEGPKAGSVRLNTTEEGDPVQEAYGRECRVAGHVLDVSELIEAQNTTSANGKGGSGAEFTEYTYSCHAMISFGLGPAEDITRIRANGKTIWAKYPNVSINSTLIAGVVTRVSNAYYTQGTTFASNNATWNNTAKTLTFSTTTVIEGYYSSTNNPQPVTDLIGRIVTVLNPSAVGLNGASFAITAASVTVSGGVRTYVLTIGSATGVSNGTLSIQIDSGTPTNAGTVWYLTMTSTSTLADLSEIQIGGNYLQITAPAGAVGNYQVVDSGTNADSTTFCKVRGTGASAPFAAFSSGTTVTLFQNNPSFSPKKMAEAPNFHRGGVSGLLGAEDAPVDELFASLRAPNPVPAYRGKIVVTFKGLQLFDYGNTLPQFEADIVQSSTAEVKDYIGQVCRDAGLGDEEFEADAITNTLLGLPMRGPSDARDRIAPVLIGYELVTSEKDGVLRFSYRKDVPTATVDAQDLSAREIGAETIRPVTFADLGDEPADCIVVTYRQQLRDYTVSVAQYNRRAEAPRTTQRIDLSLLQMEDEDAQAVAMHTALLAPVNRRQVELTLPLSYVDSVYEGVRISVPVNGRTREILVMGVTRGPTGVLEVMGIIEQSSIFDLAVSTYTPLTPGFAALGQDPGTFGNTPISFSLLDIAPLRDEHRNKVGFYLAACSESRSTRFPAAMLYQAVDENEEEWRPISRIHVDSVMGRCTTTLGDAVIGVWDEINTLDVELTSGELESVTELACLNGRNRAMVAREIIGFRTATLIGTNTYRLSGLLRGLRDTGSQMEQHVADEPFILLTGKGLEFVELEAAAVGMSRSYKMLTPGMRLPEAETFQFTCSGASSTCFAPDHIKGTRDVSNNLTIEWTRVSRANVRLLSTQAIPISEPFERYELTVNNATTGEAIRTFVVAQPSVHYSAAQQTADGLTLGQKVYVTLRQLGDLVHGGNARTAVV
jgi:hypothetical protein